MRSGAGVAFSRARAAAILLAFLGLAACATRSPLPEPAPRAGPDTQAASPRPQGTPATSPATLPSQASTTPTAGTATAAAAGPGPQASAGTVPSAPKKPPLEKPDLGVRATRLPETSLNQTARRSAYLASNLADLRMSSFPNGFRLVVKRQAGRALAAARLSLSGGGGQEALALYLAASCRGSDPQEVFASELARRGASLAMDFGSDRDAAIALLAPAPELPVLLSLIAANLVAPEFRKGDSLEAEAGVREALRAQAADPERSAAHLMIAAMAASKSPALSGLPAESPQETWARNFSAGRLSIVVVGEVEPEAIAASLGPRLGSIPKGGPTAPQAPLFKPVRAARSQASEPGFVSLRAELEAPEAGTVGYAALAVALTMMDALLAPGARTQLPGPARARPAILIDATARPREAMAGVAAAAALVASGKCLQRGTAGTGIGELGSSLEAYKAETLGRFYASTSGAEALARGIGIGLEASGDPAAFFRLADAIAALGSGEVQAAARDGFAEERLAWLALGDPGLIKDLEASGFSALPR